MQRISLMKKLFILLWLLPCFHLVKAQQKMIDSLLIELHTSKPDTNRVLLLGELAKNYYYYKPDTAIILGQVGYELAQQLNYPHGEAVCLNRIAGAYATVGD